MTLVLVGAFALLLQNMEALLDQFGDELLVTAYLDTGISEEALRDLERRVREVDGVESAEGITPDEALLERLSVEEASGITLRFARSAYEASAIVEGFQPAFVVVDQELLTAGEPQLLDHLSVDPRLPGVKIVLGVQRGTTGTLGHERNNDIIFGVIEKPLGPQRIAAMINSFPIERLLPPDPSLTVEANKGESHVAS